MNFTTYFYCDCDYMYQQAVHDLEGNAIVQCNRCSSVESVARQEGFGIVCQACDHEEQLEGDLSTTENKTCQQCGITGSIGYDEHTGEQFYLKTIIIDQICEKCHKGHLKENPEGDFRCPACNEILKQKMSSFWKYEKGEK